MTNFKTYFLRLCAQIPTYIKECSYFKVITYFLSTFCNVDETWTVCKYELVESRSWYAPRVQDRGERPRSTLTGHRLDLRQERAMHKTTSQQNVKHIQPRRTQTCGQSLRLCECIKDLKQTSLTLAAFTWDRGADTGEHEVRCVSESALNLRGSLSSGAGPGLQ